MERMSKPPVKMLGSPIHSSIFLPTWIMILLYELITGFTQTKQKSV